MQIHYFQRYHSKENVDTSNTMLMLSRLYNYNADKFFAMLNALILGQDETPEITFDLQVVGDESVPDAIISQKSFKIVVETKLHNQFQQNQLEKHLTQFGTEEIKVLLTLDPKPMKESLMDSFGTVLKKYNSDKINEIKTPIRHVNITFEQLVAAMEDIVDERDSEIMAVLDDYKKYCFDEKLIPDDENWMRAIVAGTTLEDNLKYDFYGSIIFLMGLAPNVLVYRHPAAILDRSKNKCCGLITDGEELKNNQLCFSVDTTVLHLFSDLSRTCPHTSGGWVPPLALTPKNNRSVSFVVA